MFRCRKRGQKYRSFSWYMGDQPTSQSEMDFRAASTRRCARRCEIQHHQHALGVKTLVQQKEGINPERQPIEDMAVREET